MAIAGLHNVSVLDSPFLRESQSQASRRGGGEERRNTRGSSLLQMWRELEDEQVVSHSYERVGERLPEQGRAGLISTHPRADIADSEHGGESEDATVSENECGQWSPNRFDLQSGVEDPNSFNSDRSSDLGEDERERVRQIFREWMNSSSRRCSSNISRMDHTSRAEWLGETEQERVRIIREWVQMNSQQGGARGESRDEQATEVPGQIEQVLDGLVINQNGRSEHMRRGIRKLCGRQALLDMIKNAERERQRELQGLLEHRAVSNFCHRNRIQSLLRGRFLRNGRMVESERPSSTAASELGLLRQRHTVADLREGFISRLSSFHSDTSSNGDINRNEQAQTNNSEEISDTFHDQSEQNNDASASHELSDVKTDAGGESVENSSSQDATTRVEEWQEQVSEDEVREWQRTASSESSERRLISGQGPDEDWQGNTVNESDISQNEVSEQNHLQDTSDVPYDRVSEGNNGSPTLGLIVAAENLEGNSIEDLNGEESAPQAEQWSERVLENSERDWQGASLGSNEWADGSGQHVHENQLEGASNQWSQDTRHGSLPDGFQEAVRSWLEGPSDSESLPVGRMNTFYLNEDETVYGTELRELLSRRSVSNLLRSSFRESLDRLIQSYVERQSHAPTEWELPETSTVNASAEQDLEQPSGDNNEGQVDVAESPQLALPSPSMPPVAAIWDQESHHDNWPTHDIHQRFGIEWEIVNDLRIDMARLQQRMNNMQKMLEACMDMQLELQRSIRQEVSAALNRSAGSPDVCEDSSSKDGFKWDCVRKGVCCVCCESNIDSLLYRCGHMCTCSRCADELVQGVGKCPMCRAPVVEVIRAYSIQ